MVRSIVQHVTSTLVAVVAKIQIVEVWSDAEAGTCCKTAVRRPAVPSCILTPSMGFEDHRSNPVEGEGLIILRFEFYLTSKRPPRMPSWP